MPLCFIPVYACVCDNYLSGFGCVHYKLCCILLNKHTCTFFLSDLPDIVQEYEDNENKLIIYINVTPFILLFTLSYVSIKWLKMHLNYLSTMIGENFVIHLSQMAKNAPNYTP